MPAASRRAWTGGGAHPGAKFELADRVHHGSDPLKALPVRRVYIPKPSGKRRPLGIPVILDRAHQARVVNVLEPEWEARFEPRSYGFRPGRGCHDAIAAIYQVAKGRNPRRRWVLDADLAGAFDRIAHDHILRPARHVPRKGNDPGMVEGGRGRERSSGPDRGGNSQGGVVSPVLLNIALHGMETGRRSPLPPPADTPVSARRDSPVLIRYADDFVALCHSRQQAQVKARLPRGWRPGALPSTRTRRVSSPSRTASTSWGSTSAATTASR